MTSTPPPASRMVTRSLLTVYRAELLARLAGSPTGRRWALLDETDDGAAWTGPVRGVAYRVIWSLAVEDDGQVWLHVSATPTAARRTPTWEELSHVKALFVGPYRFAYQVHPPAAEHVNIHPRVLHLWSPWDGPVLPDFTAGGRSI